MPETPGSAPAGRRSFRPGRIPKGMVRPGAARAVAGGRAPLGPEAGFGQLWHKMFRVGLGDTADPEAVVAAWKERFHAFWPPGNRFYPPVFGIAPGAVGAADLKLPAGMRIATALLVLQADERSFTLLTPQGHMFAGLVTFSSSRELGETVAEVNILMRANDPLYEAGLLFGGHRTEDRFWQQTLQRLAGHFGREAAEVTSRSEVLDRNRQWSRAGNVWHNAWIRTTIYRMGAPLRGLREILGSRMAKS